MQVMTNAQFWYIVKLPLGNCEIVSIAPLGTEVEEHWGPFPSKDEAIARRIGLIRAGECQPV